MHLGIKRPEFECELCGKVKFKRSHLEQHNCIKIRKGTCGNCSACQVEYDCDKCANCLDKPRNGGQQKLKKRCLIRICVEKRPKKERIKCECGSCAKDDCGKCPSCASKPKFGGEKSFKRRCDLKICDW